MCVCPSARPRQVQSAGLPLPERRHHAKPSVWCHSLFQGPLLPVLKLCNAETFPWPVTSSTFSHIFLYLCHVVFFFSSQPCCCHVCNRRGHPDAERRRHRRRLAGGFHHEPLWSLPACESLLRMIQTNPCAVLFSRLRDASRLLLPFVARKVWTFDRGDCHSAVMLIKN